MNDQLAAPGVLETAEELGIGHRPILIPPDTPRFPWKFHGPFGFGDNFPGYLFHPLLRELYNVVEQPVPANFFARRNIRRTLRDSYLREIKAHITRTNLTPAIVRLPEIIDLLPSLVESWHVSVTMDHLRYNTSTWRVILPDGQCPTISWRYRTLATILIDLTPHMSAAELADPGLGWVWLYRFHRTNRSHRQYESCSDEQRQQINTAWHLAVYEAALRKLAVLTNDNHHARHRVPSPACTFLRKIIDIAAQPAIV